MVVFFTPPVLLKRPGAASAIWNPADNANMTLSNANRTATTGGSGGGVRSNYITSGKRYFEMLVVNIASGGSSAFTGFADSTNTLNGSAPGGFSTDGATLGLDGTLIAQASGFFLGTGALSNGDIIGWAIDFSNHVFYVARNNTWLASGNPATGSNSIDYISTSPVAPFFGTAGGQAGSAVTLKTAGLTYAPPSGFTAGLA